MTEDGETGPSQCGSASAYLSSVICALSSDLVGASDMRDRPFDIAGPEGKTVQGFAIGAFAAEILAPAFDKHARIRLEAVFNLSVGGGTEEFERDKGMHNR
jgi:hypothetical protein